MNCFGFGVKADCAQATSGAEGCALAKGMLGRASQKLTDSFIRDSKEEVRYLAH